MLPQIKTIIFATGLGAGTPHVFRYALSLAQKHAAKIVVVHAMEPLSPFGQSLVERHISHERSEELHLEAREKVKAELISKLELLCSRESGAKPGSCEWVSEIRVIEGQADQVVIAEAEKSQADLIVLGTHRHTRLGEALLGNTARKVTHKAEQPVLLVRIPEGYHEADL